MTNKHSDPATRAAAGHDGVEAPMVTMSKVVRLRGTVRFPLQSWRHTKQLALMLAIGLPAIMLAFHLLDPTAPLAYIVLPVLAGGLLPLLFPPTGRFEIATDGDAHALATLDEALGALGYTREDAGPGKLSYRARNAGRARPIAVTVGNNKLDIAGPVAALHSLQQRLAF